jgi:hypothetical protein
MRSSQYFLWILFSLAGLVAQAQTVYGRYDSKTSQPVLTASIDFITQKFKTVLEDQNVTISNIQLIANENASAFLLTASVGRSAKGISAVGIELIRKGDEITSSIGPGIKHLCVGDPCSACRIKFNNGGPVCRCDDSPCDNCKCNHVMEVVIW